MDLYLEAVAAASDEPNKDILRLGRRAQMHFRSLYAEDRPGPGVAPLGVFDHLAFVDDRHIVAGLQIQFFRGGRHMGVVLPHVLFFSGGEAAVDPRIQQRLLGLHSQQSQRRKVDAGAGLPQAAESFVGLASVRAAQVQHEMPLHSPGLGIFVLRFEGEQQL